MPFDEEDVVLLWWANRRRRNRVIKKKRRFWVIKETCNIVRPLLEKNSDNTQITFNSFIE